MTSFDPPFSACVIRSIPCGPRLSLAVGMLHRHADDFQFSHHRSHENVESRAAIDQKLSRCLSGPCVRTADRRFEIAITPIPGGVEQGRAFDRASIESFPDFHGPRRTNSRTISFSIAGGRAGLVVGVFSQHQIPRMTQRKTAVPI